jgi:hypothetical protein
VLLHMFNDRGKFLQNVAMQTTKRAEFEAQGKALDQRALAVSECLRLLSFLTMGLRRTLEAHVSWLQGVFNLETAYVSTLQLQVPSSDGVAPQGEDMEVSALAQALAAADSDETEYLGNFASINSWSVQKRWDKVTLQYLDLICLDQTSLDSLQKAQPGFSAYDNISKSYLEKAHFEFVRPAIRKRVVSGSAEHAPAKREKTEGESEETAKVC